MELVLFSVRSIYAFRSLQFHSRNLYAFEVHSSAFFLGISSVPLSSKELKKWVNFKELAVLSERDPALSEETK